MYGNFLVGKGIHFYSFGIGSLSTKYEIQLFDCTIKLLFELNQNLKPECEVYKEYY